MKRRWSGRWRWLGRALAFCLGLLAVAGSLFVYFGHPNDSRIAGPFTAERGLVTGAVERVGSLLLNDMPHTLDMEKPAFAEALMRLAEVSASYASPRSARFRSPYQVYFPVGTYPSRLEARDAVFIPAGRTLTVEPGIEGDFQLETTLFAPRGAARLGVRVKGDAGADSAVATAVHPGGKGQQKPSFFDQKIGRYLDVDRSDLVERWEPVRAELPLGKGALVTVHCESEGIGCLVGDLGFYRKRETPAVDKKNVLMVVVDTLRGDGPTGGHAPEMQRLAAQSTIFQRALAPGNMTSPSTNALLACRRPSDLGALAFAYAVAPDRREEFYRRRRPSFPAQFTQAGYDTAMIGNVSVISEAYGVGIDHGTSEQIALETEAYDTPQIARAAVRWLSRKANRPFFLYVHFNGPHAPYRAPLKDIRSVFGGFGSLRSYPDVLLTLYQSEVHYTDRYLGAVLQALESLGVAERTTVVLTADHGDQHELRPFTGNVAGPDFHGAYFDHGATMLNDEIRVPLMIRQPGVAARAIDDLVSTLDVGPTLLDLAGLPGGSYCSGQSLTPYVDGTDTAATAQRVFGSEGFTARAIVFDNRYKYVRTYEPTDKRVYSRDTWQGPKRLFAVPEQIFDLRDDPGERRNLALSDVSLLERARTLYRDFYGIKDAFELVIDNPEAREVAAEFPIALDVSLADGIGELAPRASSLTFRGHESRRFVFRLAASSAAGPQMPRIAVDGLSVPIRATSMRLPLVLRPADLPLEAGGVGNLPDLALKPAAFVRRIEDDGQADRRIVTGNPEFEQVLREWGYLNDR